MIRIGVNRIYGMNDITTITEEDIKKAIEVAEELAKELEKTAQEKPIVAEQIRKTEPDEKKREPVKNPFHRYGMVFRSESSPSVYKLSGDLSTFDEQDFEFNNIFPQRVLNEDQRKKYIDELSNKDLLKNPFIFEKKESEKKEQKTKDELVGRIDADVEDIPKPPPKWKKFVDKEGDTYYYNVVTKLTQWNKPEEYE